MDPQRRHEWSPFFDAECAVAVHSRPTLAPMQHHAIALLLVCAIEAGAKPLAPVPNNMLASVLAHQSELANGTDGAAGAILVRVYAAPVRLGECDGTISSCPNVRLLVSVAPMEGVNGQPRLYSLPPAKGWKILGWNSEVNSNLAVFDVATELPTANVTQQERAAYQSVTYRVRVGAKTAYFEQLGANPSLHRTRLRRAGEL